MTAELEMSDNIAWLRQDPVLRRFWEMAKDSEMVSPWLQTIPWEDLNDEELLAVDGLYAAALQASEW